jgi:acyl-CoA hydrolase
MPRAAIRTVKESQVQMVQMVLPTDTNRLGNLLGGQLMHWIDIAAAIAAARHANRVCVTASVDEINFHHPIQQGDVVTLQASVNRVFRTSLEIGVRISKENLITGKKTDTNTAYLTFVAIDEKGKPTPVAPIKPVTKDEKRRFADAAHRRELRLHHRKQRH